MKKKIRQLKDQRFREYTIKIDHICQVFKAGDTTRYIDKLFCVNIKDMLGGGTAFCKPTLKEVLKEIKDHLI